MFRSAPMAGVLSLPHLWEGDVGIRARARHERQLCVWQDQRLVGIPSIRACVLNAAPLTILARWWTSQQTSPAAIPIKLLRSEAWFENQGPKVKGIFQNCLFPTPWSSKLFPTTCSFQVILPPQSITSPQVTAWRVLSALDSSFAAVTMDSWGLKRLFSHGLRRWLSGARKPKDTCQNSKLSIQTGLLLAFTLKASQQIDSLLVSCCKTKNPVN